MSSLKGRKQRTKLWRQLKKRHKYIRRLKMITSKVDGWLIDGQTIRHPRWIDVYNKKSTFCYKDTATPCSCEMCSGEHYTRGKEKSLIAREMELIGNDLI